MAARGEAESSGSRFSVSHNGLSTLQDLLEARAHRQQFGQSQSYYGQAKSIHAAPTLDKSATLRKLEALRAVAAHAQASELTYVIRTWGQAAEEIEMPSRAAVATGVTLSPTPSGSALSHALALISASDVAGPASGQLRRAATGRRTLRLLEMLRAVVQHASAAEQACVAVAFERWHELPLPPSARLPRAPSPSLAPPPPPPLLQLPPSPSRAAPFESAPSEAEPSRSAHSKLPRLALPPRLSLNLLAYGAQNSERAPTARMGDSARGDGTPRSERGDATARGDSTPRRSEHGDLTPRGGTPDRSARRAHGAEASADEADEADEGEDEDPEAAKAEELDEIDEIDEAHGARAEQPSRAEQPRRTRQRSFPSDFGSSIGFEASSGSFQQSRGGFGLSALGRHLGSSSSGGGSGGNLGGSSSSQSCHCDAQDGAHSSSSQSCHCDAQDGAHSCFSGSSSNAGRSGRSGDGVGAVGASLGAVTFGNLSEGYTRSRGGAQDGASSLSIGGAQDGTGGACGSGASLEVGGGGGLVSVALADLNTLMGSVKELRGQRRQLMSDRLSGSLRAVLRSADALCAERGTRHALASWSRATRSLCAAMTLRHSTEEAARAARAAEAASEERLGAVQARAEEQAKRLTSEREQARAQAVAERAAQGRMQTTLDEMLAEGKDRLRNEVALQERAPMATDCL